ncbi:hypothetical protein B0H13DRAFT_2324153 [Mycena leptocephala]|nr:hypothetical protein B0H13DRAFT_2324153 [Mycena leptocephala]
MASFKFLIPALFSLAISPSIIAVQPPTSAYTCKSYTVPLKNISAPSFELSFEIKTQWDITDWTINEVRRDSATAFNGIAGPSTVVGDFDISARFCTPSKPTELAQTVLVMTHGLGADKTADPHNVVQFPIQVEILASLTRLLWLQLPIHLARINRICRAFRSFLWRLHHSRSRLRVPGTDPGNLAFRLLGLFDYFNILLAGWQSRVAALLDPARWGDLQTGYAPYFDHAVAEWTSLVKSPYSVGELATLGQTPYDTSNFTKPVQVFQGVMTSARQPLNITGTFPAGHSVNLHYNASQAFAVMLDFVGESS